MSDGAERVIALANASAAATKQAIELDGLGSGSILTHSVRRVTELAKTDEDGFGPDDLVSIKELWEMIEVGLVSFGAVMRGERYPIFEGITVDWYNDVTFLNEDLGLA
jgi:hypothetical protein